MSPILVTPPAPPSGTTFTDTLLADLAPWLTSEQDPGGAHQTYLRALGTMLEPIYALAMDQGFPDDPDWIPGWSQLLDVDECPDQYLPYLAQFVGAAIPAGTDDPTARQIIRAESGQQRGTPGAIINAATRNLTGTQSVVLLERTAADGSVDAYHFVLVVRPEEVVSVAQLTVDVDAVKPGGVLWTLIQTDAWTISELEAAGLDPLTTLEGDFSSVHHLEQDVPI